jgi:hypothetical protein
MSERRGQVEGIFLAAKHGEPPSKVELVAAGE